MKRIILSELFVIAGAASLAAQNTAVNGYCVQGAATASLSGMQSTNSLQGIIPSCTVTVYITGTTTLATIYADRPGTPLSNPFTANVTTGQWIFWSASSSAFDVVLSGGIVPNIYLTPVTLTDLSPASIGSALNPLIFGCVPNSTATAVMSANVTCLNTIGNLFNRAYLPAGVWNINSCINLTNSGGFILEGAGVAGTSIIQNTSDTCAIKVNARFPNEFRIADMTIGHSVSQSPAVNEATNSPAPAIFFTGPSGASIFNYALRDLAFTKSSRGVELDKTVGGTSWGYDINGIRCNGDLMGACINLAGTNAGNPRISMHRVYNTAMPTTEPVISISQGEEVGIDDVEDTPSINPVSTPITAYSTVGSTVTLTAINGGAVAETHAATAVDGVSPVGLPFYSRWWNGAASQTATALPNLTPVFNSITGVWDNYFTIFETNTQATSRSWFSPGWLNIWTIPTNNPQDVNPNNPGLSGLVRIGGFMPGDTFGGIPVIRAYKNVGGVYVSTDFRGMADGSGTALGGICPSTSNSSAIGAETPQADQTCSFMTNRAGDWFNQNGDVTPIVSHTVRNARLHR